MSNGKAFVFASTTLDKGSLGDVKCDLRESSSAAELKYWPVTTNWYSGSRKFFVEPGRSAIDVTCTVWSSSFGAMKSKIKNRYHTEVEFVAEANHLYAIGLQSAGNICVQVIDVTDKNHKTIECQETQSLEEM